MCRPQLSTQRETVSDSWTPFLVMVFDVSRSFVIVTLIFYGRCGWRTNFAGVNNAVSPLFGLTPGFTTFNVHGILPGTALPGGGTATSSTPLAFTSAFPKRQVQLGVRLSF